MDLSYEVVYDTNDGLAGYAITNLREVLEEQTTIDQDFAIDELEDNGIVTGKMFIPNYDLIKTDAHVLFSSKDAVENAIDFINDLCGIYCLIDDNDDVDETNYDPYCGCDMY